MTDEETHQCAEGHEREVMPNGEPTECYLTDSIPDGVDDGASTSVWNDDYIVV